MFMYQKTVFDLYPVLGGSAFGQFKGSIRSLML